MNLVNQQIASIHGNLCGDGCLTKYFVSGGPGDISRYNRKNKRRLRYLIVYTNNRKELLKKFKNNLRILFPDIKFSCSKENEVRTRNKSIVKFFEKFGNFKSREWKIPKEIMNGKIRVKTAWLKSFFDDEGTIKGNRVISSSVNRNGMKQVHILLNRLKIKNKLKHYKTKSDVIVYNQKRYEKLIGFDHKLKLVKLKGRTLGI